MNKTGVTNDSSCALGLKRARILKVLSNIK